MMEIDKSWYIRPPDTPEHVSAGGVVVRLENHVIYVAVTEEIGLPRYVLPKGRVEDGETLEEAAIREIEEETGLSSLEIIGFLGQRERLVLDKSAWKTTHYFLCRTQQFEGKPLDYQHHSSLLWFPIRDLPVLFWPEQTELIQENLTTIAKMVKGEKRP